MKAVETFRHPDYKHNCAQAIAYRWKHLYDKKEAIIEHYAPYVGGRAPEGLCGALYAAMQACPAHAEAIAQEFAASVGDIHCKIIKTQGHVPCVTCVQTADDLVEKYMVQ